MPTIIATAPALCSGEDTVVLCGPDGTAVRHATEAICTPPLHPAAPGLFVLPLRPGGPISADPPRLRQAHLARCRHTNQLLRHPAPNEPLHSAIGSGRVRAEFGDESTRHQAGAAVLLLPPTMRDAPSRTSSVRFSTALADPTAPGCKSRRGRQRRVAVVVELHRRRPVRSAPGVTVVCAAGCRVVLLGPDPLRWPAADASQLPRRRMALSIVAGAATVARGAGSGQLLGADADQDRGRARSVSHTVDDNWEIVSVLPSTSVSLVNKLPVWTVSFQADAPHRSEADRCVIDRCDAQGQRGRGPCPVPSVTV